MRSLEGIGAPRDGPPRALCNGAPRDNTLAAISAGRSSPWDFALRDASLCALTEGEGAQHPGGLRDRGTEGRSSLWTGWSFGKDCTPRVSPPCTLWEDTRGVEWVGGGTAS